MSTKIKLLCINDARCQGSLTKGKEYALTGRSKMGKVEREIEVIDNNGKIKWFVESRFALVKGSETKEDVKESEVPVKKLNAADMVKATVDFVTATGREEYKIIPYISKAIVSKEIYGSDKAFVNGTPVFLVAYKKDGTTGKSYYAYMNEYYDILVADLSHVDGITDIDKSLSDKLTGVMKAQVVAIRGDKAEPAVTEEPQPAPASKVEAPHIKKDAKMGFGTFLEKQGVPSKLIKGLEQFREFFKFDDEHLLARVPQPKQMFIGGEVWTDALAALLSGENVLLEGGKATGKNTLCECLSFAFGRPQWDTSFHSNITASQLVGNDTFKDGQVVFNPGMIYLTGKNGGFGILDEINMAKSEAVAVLHSALDNRRSLDVPGYDMLKFHEATRFIGTMNYGYSGTREMNEALVSRFTVINVPELDGKQLNNLLKTNFPDIKNDIIQALVGLFQDLQAKAKNTEISTKAVDLRGIQSALKLMKAGVAPKRALERGIVGKAFEESERQIVRDLVNVRIADSWTLSNIMEGSKEMIFDFSKVR